MLRSLATYRTLQFLAYLVIIKTVAAVVLSYHSYFPPDFRTDFLLGRSDYFFGAYQWAFYIHIFAGPLVLIAGLLLLSHGLRRRFPQFHRALGRIQVGCILLLVVPSGLWMAWYAASGPVAISGFASLAVATAICTAAGWRAAMRRQFAGHQRWMQRSFLLLCAAVVLRIIGGFCDVFGIEAVYGISAWLSWLGPLALFEMMPAIQQSRLARRWLTAPAG